MGRFALAGVGKSMKNVMLTMKTRHICNRKNNRRTKVIIKPEHIYRNILKELQYGGRDYRAVEALRRRENDRWHAF